jgi:pimeloyl-ACP methyl ester carboxylesterase
MAFVDSAGARIYYETHGGGPAIVFAHGRGGNAASWWRQVPHFSERYRVIVFDHRTFGRSTGGGEAFTPRQLAADAMAILDAEGIERAALVAQSMGGWTCLAAALAYPERVQCLVLSSTTGGIASPEMEPLLAEWRDRAAGQAPLASRALAPDFPEREPALATLYAQLQAFNTGFDPACMETLRDPANAVRPEQLRGFAVPTLFVIAGQDQIFQPALLRMAAAAVPGAGIEEFPGAGHSPYWEDAPRFNEVVGRFLARHLDA